MAYDNTNKGSLFKNSMKKSSGDPDYSGRVNIEGETHNIVATRKMSGPRSKKPNMPFFAITFVNEGDAGDDFDTPTLVGSAYCSRTTIKSLKQAQTTMGHWNTNRVIFGYRHG